MISHPLIELSTLSSNDFLLLLHPLVFEPLGKGEHAYTIARVAEMLGEDEDWLGDVANEMDREDGLIWRA